MLNSETELVHSSGSASLLSFFRTSTFDGSHPVPHKTWRAFLLHSWPEAGQLVHIHSSVCHRIVQMSQLSLGMNQMCFFAFYFYCLIFDREKNVLLEGKPTPRLACTVMYHLVLPGFWQNNVHLSSMYQNRELLCSLFLPVTEVCAVPGLSGHSAAWRKCDLFSKPPVISATLF